MSIKVRIKAETDGKVTMRLMRVTGTEEQHLATVTMTPAQASDLGYDLIRLSFTAEQQQPDPASTCGA